MRAALLSLLVFSLMGLFLYMLIWYPMVVMIERASMPNRYRTCRI